MTDDCKPKVWATGESRYSKVDSIKASSSVGLEGGGESAGEVHRDEVGAGLDPLDRLDQDPLLDLSFNISSQPDRRSNVRRGCDGDREVISVAESCLL